MTEEDRQAHSAGSSSPHNPVPILKKHHPASQTSSPRPRSPLPAPMGESGTGQATDVSYSPINPSPLRSTVAAPETAASVTFSEATIPTTSSVYNAFPATQIATNTPHHSILKSSHSTSSSRRNSVSEGNDDASSRSIAASSEAPPQKLNAALLQLPHADSATGRIGSPSSSPRHRSVSPPVDRSRAVGRGGYGGRRGGPSMMKSRTSSSGGLSDGDIRPGYERKVGFDTMTDAEDTPNGYFSFCLQVKSQGYQRTKNTRTFMCAVDDNPYSERALEWLMESLISDGDEIVAVRILEGDQDEIDQEAARDEARDLMARILQLNDEVGHQSISIVVEFLAGQAWGRAVNSILSYIYMYRPDSLTVGTRGKSMSTFQKMLGGSSMGSCSRDILNRTPVPVVIVRPEAKVKKHLSKRQNDPKRRSYHDLVALQNDESLPLSVSSRRSSRIIPHGFSFGGHHHEDK